MRGFTRKNPHSSAIRAASLAARISRYSPAALTGFAALLLMSSLINPGLWSTPRKAATDLFAPLVSFVSAPFRVAADGVGELTGLTQIRAENARLASENAKLKEWYQTAMLLQAENQSLKDLLNVIPEPDQSYITTRVIGDSGSAFIKTLLIQAGANDGVDEGQAVMGGQGMVGRVIETSTKAARILLLTDINSHIPVIIEGANQRAILAGTNEDLLVLEHMPQDALVTKGARIVTSGHGGMFPAGLPIGEISEVKDGQAYVRMYSDPASTSFVQIIQKPQDPNVRQSIDTLTAPAAPDSAKK